MKKILIGLLFILLLAGCTTEVTTAKTSQPCPEWTGNEEGICELLLVKKGIKRSRSFVMNQYEMARITIINGNLVMKSKYRINVQTQSGELFDWENSIFIPGTYIFSVEQSTDTTHFVFQNVGAEKVTILAEAAELITVVE